MFSSLCYFLVRYTLTLAHSEQKFWNTLFTRKVLCIHFRHFIYDGITRMRRSAERDKNRLEGILPTTLRQPLTADLGRAKVITNSYRVFIAVDMPQYSVEENAELRHVLPCINALLSTGQSRMMEHN